MNKNYNYDCKRRGFQAQRRYDRLKFVLFTVIGGVIAFAAALAAILK